MNYELLSATDRDAICGECTREYLSPLGLAEVTPRTWVDGSRPPVRRMFELQLLKGAGVKACWGFSLDFVPHISGGRVRWHRSDKSARLDVIIDPPDLRQPSFLHGAPQFSADLRRLLPEASARAQATWTKGATSQGMLDIICEIRQRNTNCFAFYNYTQLPLAYAFLSARVGDARSADWEIDHYATLHKLDEDEACALKMSAREFAVA